MHPNTEFPREVTVSFIPQGDYELFDVKGTLRHMGANGVVLVKDSDPSEVVWYPAHVIAQVSGIDPKWERDQYQKALHEAIDRWQLENVRTESGEPWQVALINAMGDDCEPCVGDVAHWLLAQGYEPKNYDDHIDRDAEAIARHIPDFFGI